MRVLAPLFSALAHLGCRNPRVTTAGAAALLLCAPWLLEGLRVEADASRVIPYEDALALAYRENRALFGEANRLVIELRYSEVSPAAVNKFTDRLAQTLEAWDDIRYLDHQPFAREGSEEYRMSLRAALLNSEPAVLEDFMARFGERGMRRELLRTRKRLIALDDPALRQQVSDDVLNLRSFLVRFQEPRIGPVRLSVATGYLDAPGGGSRLVVLQPTGSAEESTYCIDLVDRLDAAIEKLKAEQDGAHAIEHRLTGIHVVTAESTRILFRDMTVISAAAAGLLFVVVWLAFGQLRATLLCFLPLLVSQVGIFILARFFFNPIHFLTIGFAAVVVGLGLDFGLHLTARFAQFASKDGVEAAVHKTLTDAGPPVVIGAVSTAVAFLALLFTDNRGLIQFGALTSVGLLVTLAVTLLLFPALAKLLGGPLAESSRGLRVRWIPVGLFRFAASRPAFALAIAVPVLLVSLPLAADFQFDDNIRQLFPDHVPALDVAAEISESYGESFGATTGITVRAPDLELAMAEQRQLDDRLAAMVDRGDVARFESPSLYLAYPAAVEEKRQAWERAREEVRQGRVRFRRLLAKLRFRLTPELEAYYDRIESVVAGAREPSADPSELPRLKRYFARTDDGYRLQTYVAPTVSEDGGSAPMTLRVTRKLEESQSTPGTATSISGLVQIYQRVNELMLADFARISWLATALVAVIVLIFFRSLTAGLVALVPLAAALPATVAVLEAADIRLLPQSIGFAAIIIGVGIDDAVHILTRTMHGSGGIRQALAEIGPIITLTTVSTMIGFGALALCSLAVVSSLGLAVAIGVGACWFFSMFLLPAACGWVVRTPGQPAAVLLLGAALAAFTVAPASAQPKTAAEIMDKLQETTDSVEAFSCRIRQVKTIEQFEGEIRLEGPLLYQKPHYVKLDMEGDENISLYSDGDSIWLVDRDLEEVEKVPTEGANAKRRLARLLPPLFFLSREEVEEGFEIVSTEPQLSEHRLEMTPRVEGEFPFERLDVDIDGRFRIRRMALRFSNGDSVDTFLQDCKKLGRISTTVFQYHGESSGTGN